MSVSAKDKRMHARWPLKSNVSVFMRDGKAYFGLLVDCSDEGLMISTYDSLEIGARFQLDLVDMPANVAERRTGQCLAEVVWSDKITPSLYGNGFRIMEASPTLNDMMKDYTTELVLH